MHSYQNSNKCALHLIGTFSIGARRSYAFLCVSMRSDAFRDDGLSSFFRTLSMWSGQPKGCIKQVTSASTAGASNSFVVALRH